ncbi:hypothetical protein ACVIW2_002886 [Bradyrhizobium huanghuaihaiense]
MRTRTILQAFLIPALMAIGACFIATARAQDVDWQKVDETLGRKPAVTGDVHRYGFPRTDLTVTLDGVTIKPALALGGWVAFKPAHGGVMAMGDLVLLESEINPVMLKMIASGLEITAVHNHLLGASPATFYMHVAGHGDPVRIATALKEALAESKTPLSVPAPTAPPPAVDLDTAQLDQIIGVKGQANGGVYQFNVPRRDPVTEQGMQLSPVGPMGVASAINFQPTGAGKARHHRRLRVDRRRGEPGHQGVAVARHRRDGAAQPHVGRTAAPVLHAFLGQRRRRQARQWLAGRARQDGEHEELIENEAGLDRALPIRMRRLRCPRHPRGSSPRAAPRPSEAAL